MLLAEVVEVRFVHNEGIEVVLRRPGEQHGRLYSDEMRLTVDHGDEAAARTLATWYHKRIGKTIRLKPEDL